MPRDEFVPRRTTRLVPGDDSREVDVISIARALGEKNRQIVGLQPRFGGKAYDITWISEQEAFEAATRGVDINEHHFELRLLGRTTDVSIFVACEFPDHYLVDLLDNYGDFNDETIRHLKLKDEGLTHIENGVRVVTFNRIDRPIPHTIVYRGTPLGFRYTGQPKLCFKCASPDHVVRDCPKKLPPPAPEQTENNDQQQTARKPPQETPKLNQRESTETENDADTSDMEIADPAKQTETDVDLSKEPSSKRARISTPPASDTEHPPNIPVSQASSPESTPVLFTPTPGPSTCMDTQTPVTPQQASDKPTGKRQKKFLDGLGIPGKARRHLIKTLKPAEHFYKARALWLQYKSGNFTEASAQYWSVNDKEAAEWRKLKGTINQDAFAALLHLYTELSKKFNLFPTKS